MIPIYEADRLEDLPLFDRPPQAEEDVDAAAGPSREKNRPAGTGEGAAHWRRCFLRSHRRETGPVA